MDEKSGEMQPERDVALFVTCLADLMRPSVAQASLQLLQDAGCRVSVPRAQTCCGQPGYNSGDYRSAAAIARQVIERFEGFEYVVLPSGSCAGMMIKHYPKLLEGVWRERAQEFARRVYELSDFLLRVCDYQPHSDGWDATMTYHDGCAGLRELGIRQQPRELLARAGITLQELQRPEVCCGFGGTFCAKMPDISADMADRKLSDIQSTGADTVLAGDLGCLLALAGRARRCNNTTHFRHFAEILAGETSSPAIAEADER
jgi:L-lactate dehydrogenase complex protein LldE